MSKKTENKNRNKQNNAMFLYTALIFVVALILIILAFFGQKNLTNLRKSTENIVPTPTNELVETNLPTETPKAVADNAEELAKLTNTLSNIKSENDRLSIQLTMYENLLAANGYISVGNIAEATAIIQSIDSTVLTDDQMILYNQIQNSINEGKGQ